MTQQTMSFSFVYSTEGDRLGVGDDIPYFDKTVGGFGSGYITELDRASDRIAVLIDGQEQGFTSAELGLVWELR